jgi:hypothetical protein
METRDLTPEFKKKFVMKIGGPKGKDAVLYNGLLALAHEDKRYGHIESYITQYPSAENKFTAFARAEIFDKNGKRIGMEEADANANNCGKMTAASFPRMALTRAKGRAFRDFLNVDMVTMEEVQVYEPDLAKSKQIGTIKRLAKKLKMKKSVLFDLLYDLTGTDQMQELTEREADEVIKELKDREQAAVEEADDEMDFSDDE